MATELVVLVLQDRFTQGHDHVRSAKATVLDDCPVIAALRQFATKNAVFMVREHSLITGLLKLAGSHSDPQRPSFQHSYQRAYPHAAAGCGICKAFRKSDS